MGRLFSISCLWAVLMVCCGVAWADDRAEVAIYLFQGGQPVDDAELIIDPERRVRSDRNGSIHMLVTPGRKKLLFQRHDKPLHTLELNLSQGENIQVIMTLFTDGRPVEVDIESSNSHATSLAKQKAGAQTSNATPGTLSGRIVSAETGVALANAQVFVSGLSDEIRTNATGHYSAKVPAGQYTVSVLLDGFNTQTREQIDIQSRQTRELSFELTPTGLELPEFVVLEPNFEGSIASVLEEQKSSASVASVLGAEQIARAGDSDAASALKRATGLTLIGGKFIYVRGLGERYSTTLLNNASIPSPDPTRRVVPLDLFPASILGSVLIQKSYSVSRPAEFAGGTVELRTRMIPDDFFARVNTSIGFNEGTTGDNGLRYDGGDWDFFGFDDGTRELPSDLAAAIEGGQELRLATRFSPEGISPEALEGFGESLSNTWDIDRKAIGPDANTSLSMGDVFRHKDFEFGYIAAARWDQSWDTLEEKRRQFSVSGNGLSLIKDFNYETTKRTISTNLYLSLEGSYTENHRVFATGLLVRQAEDEARIFGGFTDSEDANIRRFELEWEETELFSRQFGGEHTLTPLFDLGVDWLYTRARARRNAPNERRYRYDDLDNDGVFEFSQRADNHNIIFSELVDQDESFRVDFDLPITFIPDVTLNLQWGYLSQEKQRDSSIRRFRFDQRSLGSTFDPSQSLETILSDENIGLNGFTLSESTLPTDTYVADQSIKAYYGQIDTQLFDTLRLTGGYRVEKNEQNVTTFQLFNPDVSPLKASLNSTDVLPAITGTLSLSDQQQIRASFSETLSRPDFRELSPAFYVDPETDQRTIGNPNLQQSSVKSYDLRWEYYFAADESISAAFFWKDIKAPIEKIRKPGPAGLLTLENADTANVYGVEAELFKHLGFVHPRLENFFLAGNYTWTRSEITLLPSNLEVLTSKVRTLQGHSPYIVNIQFGYDNPNWGTSATVLYNTFGERITEVGSLGAPDKFEQPFHQLDFVWRQDLMAGFRLVFKARNLLDDQIIEIQGNETTRAYRKGREFSLGLNWSY